MNDSVAHNYLYLEHVLVTSAIPSTKYIFNINIFIKTVKIYILLCILIVLIASAGEISQLAQSVAHWIPNPGPSSIARHCQYILYLI